MIDRPTSQPIQRWQRAIGLFGLLLAVYFASYTGQPYSNDELHLYDAAFNLAQRGVTEHSYTSALRYPFTYPDLKPVDDALQVEPFQVQVVAFLIKLAMRLPGVGLIQFAWLLSTVVTALAGVVFYYYAGARGYSERTALIGALIFGLATIVWPYSRMLFREPLLMLLGLLTVYAGERVRLALTPPWRWRQAVFWIAFGGLAFFAALRTKDTGLFFLPVALIAGIPDRSFDRLRRAGRRRILAIGALFGAVALFSTLVILSNSEVANRLQQAGWIGQFTGESLSAYLFSPGYSIWAFSPILLLIFPGLVLLIRQRHYRQIVITALIAIAFLGALATIYGRYWYAGLGWGPRLIVPITPFLALWLLPVVAWCTDGLWRGTRNLILRLAALIVIAFSLMVQLLAVYTPVRAHSDFLYEEGKRQGRDILPWREGTWQIEYTPLVVNTRRLGETPPPLAWMQIPNTESALLMCLVAAGIGGLAAIGRIRRRTALIGVFGTSGVMLIGGLLLYYPDPRFGGDDAMLWRMLNTLNSEVASGDAVILGNATYRPFFMNYYKRAIPVYVLPDAGGEILRPDEAPYIVSDNMEERAEPIFQLTLSRLALRTTRWWFVTENNVFTTGRYRVIENYLTRHYFPVREAFNDPRGRLILFAPIGAPPDSIPPWPELPLDADFGAARLIGADLPRGTTIQLGNQGAFIGVSLLWKHEGWPSGLEAFDYSVNVTLFDRAGVTRAQRAEAPQGTFGKMSLWQQGGYYRDNHGLYLPPDLPAGDYDLMALIFDWRDGGKTLPLRNMTDDRAKIATITIVR